MSAATCENTQRWATVEQTANYLSVSKQTVNRLIARRNLRVVRIGRAVRVDLQSVDEFTKKQAVEVV